MSIELRARERAARRDDRGDGKPRVVDVLRGLHATPKRIPTVFLYDRLGSGLFERICAQPEYYPTRVETQILRQWSGDIARMLGPGCLLVEYGSGASAKTRLLLDELMRPSAYVPVDISSSALYEAAHLLRGAYRTLEVLPVLADFTRPFQLPRTTRPPQRVAVFFPGSTIGNFDPVDAVRLMRAMRTVAGPGGALVIGADLVKDVARLEAAYDDRAGATAAFNLNALRHLNRELGADFLVGAFTHEAVWVPELSRIEMRLVSQREQRVHLGGEVIGFARGERLVTEHCHKYTIDSFQRLARAAGWAPRRVWTDAAGDFSVHYLVAPGN